ncbi:MAG: hypothetical protein GY936_15295 [Ignavibacteriae bacterium]|nr:hypothetical protein [Ignavibacteriota bacterium]
MKNFKTYLSLLVFSLLFVQNANANNLYVDEGDSVNVMVEASLFFEAYKNKQYEKWTIDKGFNVINTKPDFMPKYTIYKKIDKVIWAVYNDSSSTEELKTELADTVLFLYDKAVEYDSANKGTYLVRRGFILEKWRNEEFPVIIETYENAFATGQKITSEIFYMDQLGSLYRNNMSEENDYQMKALDLYLKLADMEPENGRWMQIVSSLAEDDEELQGFMQKAWYLDKENGEKAWSYAKICKRNEDFAAAIEPLSFLTNKSPEVTNYWKQLASTYQKNDQTDMAVSSYKKLINLQPDNRESYFNLALLYKDMDQFSVARNYLRKAAKVSPGWDYPLYIEANLYESAARSCGFEFEDKCAYKLAQDTYRKVANMGGENASAAKERVGALVNSVPTKEDYFFRKKKNGDVIKIEGKCYGWIGKSITVKF